MEQAAALLVRKMEETQIRDEPSSVNGLLRLLGSGDCFIRATAALGLGFLTSRVEVRCANYARARSCPSASACMLTLTDLVAGL